MGIGKYLLLFSSFASFVYIGNGCSMEGVGNWLLTQDEQILDVYRGTFWRRSTSNIQSITGIAGGGSVNYANYLTVELDEDNYFTISTSEGYAQYEENETSEYISFTVTFSCVGGSSSSLIFSIRVQDTNNNPPTFRPSDQYEFTITPPLPPNFRIPGDDIIVRDIDLTTSSIEFTIEDNPYFDISYEGRSSTDPKEFLASLTTKDLIRSLSEDLELTISATDVDATGDPPITTYATIKVKADESFIFPEEPVFSQPFYMATYTNNQVVLEQTISLRQGYDDEVEFSLDGEHSDYFGLVPNGNMISIEVRRALSNEILRSGRIILVVRAQREYTSGGTATVIVQLPEVLGLEFEQPHYEGRIVDNVLETLQLTLKQGYEDDFTINIQGEYASYFSTSFQGNVITLQMMPLESNIIDSNNFINLQVMATNQFSTAAAVVTLDIIKDDNVSPAFEKAIYTGEYDRTTGLAVEQITLGQGYDETIVFTIQGEHSEYFSIDNVGPVITLASSGIPTEIWKEKQLLLTVSAQKPRAVTATTTVSIQLPSARELAFENPSYSGTLQDNTLTLGTIVLSLGYAEDVSFTLSGEYASYFALSPAQNGVTIDLSAELPDDVITENNFLTLILSASGLHAVPTSTTILLEIIKQDLTTPVFTENIYTGSYLGANSIEIGSIGLAQGYDSSVTFRLDGEHAQYFEITDNSNNVNLALVSNVPPEVIFGEKVLLFNIIAEKPLTVGANAAISIAFPPELTDATIMRFSQNTYIGSLEENTLTLENIVLETGYADGTELSLNGDYASYFQVQNTDNVINIIVETQLSEEILDNNEFIILEVEASRERAVSVSASVVIDIKKKDIVSPVFSNAYYKTVFSDGNLHDLTITLSEGYDETVTFELQGDSAVWFSITNNENNIQLVLNTPAGDLPEDILTNNDYFLFSVVANKPNTVSARAAIFIHLPKEIPETVLLQFSQTSYVGRIESGELYAPTISLLVERDPIDLYITGDYTEFFEVTQISPTNVQVQLKDGSLPENIEELPFIIIDIEAQYPEAISGHTTVILEVVKEPEIVTPVFEQAYYIGEYSGQGGLQFEDSIQLSQGFDESVVFTLAGDDAQWFNLNNVAENSFTLVVSGAGLEQISDRSHLVFSVVANKAGSVAGLSAVIINLSDFTTTKSLRFAQDFYVGSIENNILSLDSIIIEEGYSSDLNIIFSGDHKDYLQLTNQEGILTLQLSSDLPVDIIDDNNVLVFTLEAQIEDTRTHTTIVLEIIKTTLTPLAFEEAYYVGSYSIIGGFTFDPRIALTEGYDETVSFSLEGDDSQWFGIVENQYPLLLTQLNPIPNEVISNNRQLIFVIIAEKSGHLKAKSTVIVSIIDDTTVLEFERNVYLGTIQENDLTIDIDTITLTKGYSENVSFDLLGDLKTYFSITQEEASVRVTLHTNIPNELIPKNGIILLDLQASASQSISAYTTLVFGIIRQETTPLSFNEVYYTGHYSESDGLNFQTNIILVEGNDESVQFNLEGDDSQFFEIEEMENILSLRLVNTIPTELIINHRPLIFTIRADRSDGVTTRATIVIALIDETESTVLRFDSTTYLGTMENNAINLGMITLNEGYHQDVSFSLHGELESYFSVTNVEAIVTITLDNQIPEDLIPANGIIILELRASAPNAVSAYATIVFAIVREDIVVEHPAFSNTYYTGHFTETEGLIFNDVIELVEGYDETVQFNLEGDDSQYFETTVTENLVSLKVITPIPSEVVTSKQQLIFSIRAAKPNATPAIATIVISLIDDSPDTTILRFDRISYLGLLENNILHLESINLREGNVENVIFELDGDLSSYFTTTITEGTITLNLKEPIPEEMIPENNLIILELQATAPQAISAYTAIVIDIVQPDDNQILDQLIFNEPYYTGHYTEAESLIFTNSIKLTEGYNENIVFTLEGDGSQYFEVVKQSENDITLGLNIPIPSEVVMNNHHLIFTIRAERPDAFTARATIVIALYDENTENLELLGFDKITYVGSLDGDNLSLDQITLREGYSDAVSFRLFGDLVNYFALTYDEGVLTVTLSNSIPEQLIPESRIIILEIEASATGIMSAHATIVIEVVREENTPTLEQLVLNEVYYTGHYTEADGLKFSDTITLTEGYDENVIFTLEGESSQYFEAVVVTYNAVGLILTAPIPSAVVLNNHQLIFTIRADKPNAVTARATVVISLLDDLLLGFDRISYMGSIDQASLNLDSITLSEGYTEAVTFRLHGDLSNYFTPNVDGATVTISLNTLIPEELLPENRIILLELEASAPDTSSARAAIILKVVLPLEQLTFSNAYYTGFYTQVEGLTFEDYITLKEGYNDDVIFTLEGDDSQYFDMVVVSENSISLSIGTPIPSAVVANNHQLIFTIHASKPNDISTRSTIIISLKNEYTETTPILGFNRISYVGSIEDNVANVETIVLREGYSSDVEFTLHGDLSNYFTLNLEGATVTISLNTLIPEELVPENRIILLELEASAPDTLSAHAAIILEVVQKENLPLEQLSFSDPYYTGFYTQVDGLTFENYITLKEGYNNDVTFTLEGDDSQYFDMVVMSENSITLRTVTPIPSAVVATNHHLIFTIHASKSNAISTRATIIISLKNEYTETTPILGFSRISYIGSIEDNVANVETIVLSEGYSTDVEFKLHGDLQNYFTLIIDDATVAISLITDIPEEVVPSNNIIVLEIQASAPDTISAHATIVLEVVQEDVGEIAFGEPYYTGHYSAADGLKFDATITLSQGHDATVVFSLDGEHAQWFQLSVSENTGTISMASPIPEDVLQNNRKLIFFIVAQKSGISTRATIVISILYEAVCADDASFGKVLYEGIVQGGDVLHEAITITGYDGTDIQLLGVNAALFSASLSEGVVTITGLEPVVPSPDVSYVALQLQAGTASAVLLLDVVHDDGNPDLPSVTFGSSSYTLSTDVTHTGVIGLVQATSDNNEAVAYSLDIDNVHLQQRLTINHDGELVLWAPANTGVYNFHAIATTVFSKVPASVPVYLTVEAITNPGDDDYELPPLQILNRDEESAHMDLVPFDASKFVGCRFSLSNRWPASQSWLYVDDTGLHANAIDREHESIAFMALSQIQVELVLQCDSDNEPARSKRNESSRYKRSVDSDLTTEQLEHLGPYDYGNSRWIVTDSIRNNPRRSLVNLIVNDINDNYPIFIGKQDDPVVVGYPVSDLEERILPRALIEVQATDADVGLNAALVYWSSEETIAVSPTTGAVHVRDSAELENNMVLTVNATDRNGQGLTGSLEILVKLIDTSHIVVVTIKDAFLDDEQNILSNLTAAVGYEVKSLRSTVISDNQAEEEVEEEEQQSTRKKREAIISSGVLLQLYVYGIFSREPVDVERLKEDIITSTVEAVIIESTVSLEDHLENLVISPLAERDIALFVSTIVLAILLFILIVAAAVWFFLKWQKKENYEEFSDENSLSSQRDSVSPIDISKPEQPTPRMNIEELKRSERRLKEMLDAPMDVESRPAPSQSTSQTYEKPLEAKVNIPELPLVIQSFDKLKNADESDDEDEFGERKKNRRKSVVTFNENVEKIIHVEDPPDDPDVEVFRL